MSAGTSTKAIANASPTAKRRQLDDWSDSPRELTKESAATAPLPALTRYSLASAPQLPIEPWESINMGLGRAGVCLAPCSSRPLTRAFACLELTQSSSSSCLPSSLSQQPLQTTFHRTHSRLRQPASQPIPSHQHSPSQTRQATSELVVRPGNCNHVSKIRFPSKSAQGLDLDLSLYLAPAASELPTRGAASRLYLPIADIRPRQPSSRQKAVSTRSSTPWRPSPMPELLLEYSPRMASCWLLSAR